MTWKIIVGVTPWNCRQLLLILKLYMDSCYNIYVINISILIAICYKETFEKLY